MSAIKSCRVRNNYDYDVFNGDIGRVIAIERLDKKVHIQYPDKQVAYDTADLGELVLAYATTIHKAQGSEYPAVVIPLHTQHYLMLQRNLLYTGITRAKGACCDRRHQKGTWHLYPQQSGNGTQQLSRRTAE